MSKHKKKNVEKHEFTEKNALRLFSKATCMMVKLELQDVEVEDLIVQLYFTTDNEMMNNLIRQFEKQLILSKVDEYRFQTGLNMFYINTEKYIRENRYYNEYLELMVNSFIILKKKATKNVQNAYFNLLIQLNAYLAGGTKRVIYGTTRLNNKGLLYCDEVVKYLTEINFDINSLPYSDENKLKLFKKYGYKDINLEKIEWLSLHDKMVTNMLGVMAYFITDETHWLYPYPYRNPTDMFRTHMIMYKLDIEELKEKLTWRQNMLPSDGVVAVYENCRDIYDITMCEVIENMRIILLFKVRFTDDTYASGFYDTYNKVFYDMWCGSSIEEITTRPMQNVILESYALMTLRLTEEEKSEFIMLTEVKNFIGCDRMLPYVRFELKKKIVPTGQGGSRNFDLNSYCKEMRNIDAFTRKLPVGSVASEEAKELARSLCIELPPDRTFVKEFSKKVYTKVR